MLGIKQMFRKEEGTCPICDIAYKRVKRDLRADCFDASYVITAWTLLCPECGYSLILPGIAKILPIAKSTVQAGATGPHDLLLNPIQGVTQDGDAADASGATAHAGDDIEDSEAMELSGHKALEGALPLNEYLREVKTMDPPEEDGGGSPAEPRQGTVPQESAKENHPADIHTDTQSHDESDHEAADNGRKTPETGRCETVDKTNEKRIQGPGVKTDEKNAAPADVRDNRQAKPEKTRREKSVNERKAPVQQSNVKSGMIGQNVRPTPSLRQAGPFSSGGMGGFPTGSIFPASAFDQLDSVKAFVQEAEKKEGIPGKNGADTQASRKTTFEKKEAINSKDRTENLKKSERASNEKDNMEKTNDKSTKNDISVKIDDGVQDVGNKKPTKAYEYKDVGNSKPETTTFQKKLSAENKPGVMDQGRGGEKKNSDSTKSLSADSDTSTARFPEQHAGSDVPKDMEECPVMNSGSQKASDKQDDAAQTEAADLSKSEAETGTPQSADSENVQSEPEDQSIDGGMKGAKAQAITAARKIHEKLPSDIADRIPVIAQIAKQQKRSIFLSEEKRYLESHVPHMQAIINEMVYDTDTSEMFLRVEGQYGLDNPCVHYNYRTKNGNFFRCTVKYKCEDSIRALDTFEAKRLLEGYPDLYKKFFPDSVSDA